MIERVLRIIDNTEDQFSGLLENDWTSTISECLEPYKTYGGIVLEKIEDFDENYLKCRMSLDELAPEAVRKLIADLNDIGILVNENN